jgi:hypothetical protein
MLEFGLEVEAVFADFRIPLARAEERLLGVAS